MGFWGFGFLSLGICTTAFLNDTVLAEVVESGIVLDRGGANSK